MDFLWVQHTVIPIFTLIQVWTHIDPNLAGCECEMHHPTQSPLDFGINTCCCGGGGLSAVSNTMHKMDLNIFFKAKKMKWWAGTVCSHIKGKCNEEDNHTHLLFLSSFLLCSSCPWCHFPACSFSRSFSRSHPPSTWSFSSCSFWQKWEILEIKWSNVTWCGCHLARIIPVVLVVLVTVLSHDIWKTFLWRDHWMLQLWVQLLKRHNGNSSQWNFTFVAGKQQSVHRQQTWLCKVAVNVACVFQLKGWFCLLITERLFPWCCRLWDHC